MNLVSLIPEFTSLNATITLLSWVYDYEFMDTDLCSCVDFLLQYSSPGKGTNNMEFQTWIFDMQMQ